MPILEEASVQDRKRLLELFPIATLRAVWPDIQGTKDEVCHAIGEKQPIDQIVNFADEHLGCCKQHVYIFRKQQGAPALPITVLEGEPVRQVPGGEHPHALYVTRSVNRVV